MAARALITGAGAPGGIGMACARALGQAGFALAITATTGRIHARAAELLAIAPGTPCLVVERRTWSGGLYVTHVRLTYPGEKHELVAEFAPSHPKQGA